jgi:hypothetical protein
MIFERDDKKNLMIPKVYSKAVIEEGQTIQWPQEKGQKGKQQSTNHYEEN